MNLEPLRAALAGPLAPLAQYRQFVLWRLEANDNGKPTKVPYGIDGKYAKSTDATTWTDANTALQYAQHWQGFGVGFVLGDADPFRVIDIDHCLVNGAWTPLAHEVIAAFPGAAVEVSQSGEGLHVWLQGPLPAQHGNKSEGLELYARERFIALTGFGVQPNTSAAANFSNLESFVAQRFPYRASSMGDLVWHPTAITEAGNVPADDEDLLRVFLTAPAKRDAAQAFAGLTGGAVTERVPVTNADLWHANVEVLSQAFPSDKGDAFDKSTAAFSLACRLAYWTGKDCPRIERLMNRAAFQRTRAQIDRVRGETYMTWDIKRACAATTNVRHWSAPQANAAVVADAQSAFDEYYDRVRAVADVHAMRTLGAEIGADLRIDPTLRELLAAHVQTTLADLGHRLPIRDARSIVAMRASHPAPDRRMLQRQANIAMNLPEETILFAPVMQTSEMIAEFVFISEGSSVASINDRSMLLPLNDFRNTFAASVRVLDDGRTISNVDEWMKHESRLLVTTRTFHAGAPWRTTDPGGKSALNAWRPIARGAYTVDIAPFLEHIQYLFGADADSFLDWLAHIEQHPGVLPHHGWLHIADSFGTGRNWLASVISRLWRGYVAPSVNMDALISGGFNGDISGKVIAIVDEIRAGARDDAYMIEGKIRNMLTEETRAINPKYGRPFLEHNACRWLLFSNHKNAIPMDDNDRRWYVVHLASSPRAEHVYAYLYGLLDNPAFIDSLGVWLRSRDLSRFNPGARPPVTEAKKRAIEAAKSDFQRMAALLVKHWPSDFITTADLHSVMTEGDMKAAGTRLNGGMKNALHDVGAEQCDKQIYDAAGGRHRVWILRNVDRWRADLSIICVEPELAKMRATMKGTGYQSLMALF